MKLSEAIMKGIELYPQQGFGDLIQDGSVKAACALGCAYGAVMRERTGIIPLEGDVNALEKMWPELTDRYSEDDTLYNHVCWLNDQLGFTRESIADWLRERGY